MSSLNSLQCRQIAAKNSFGQTYYSLGKAFILHYIGTGTITSVIVTTATDITFITSDGGTDAYTWAAYTTLGALVDAINKDGIFEAKILDGLRSFATGASYFVTGTLTAASNGSENVYSILWDNSTATIPLFYRLTYDRTFGTGSKLRDGHRVHIQEIVTSLTLGGGADANAFKIYECKPTTRGSVETLLVQRTPTSGSVVTLNFASGFGKITSSDGNDLVVSVADATSFAATDYITVAGILE